MPRKRTRGRQIQIINGKVINHNWTYTIKGKRKTKHYTKKHFS